MLDIAIIWIISIGSEIITVAPAPIVAVDSPIAMIKIPSVISCYSINKPSMTPVNTKTSNQI